MDIEILIPLDQEVKLPGVYMEVTCSFDKCPDDSAHRESSFSVKHDKSTIDELNAYILEHKLIHISTGYNVTVKAARTPLEIDSMEV